MRIVTRPTFFALALVQALALPVLAQAQPRSFDGLSCTSNIEQELAGRTMPNETVAVLESRYKALGLKDVGGDEISDKLSLTTWRICGDQYLLLQQGDRVKSVLKIPEQYRSSGDVFPCVPVGGKDGGYIIAVPGARGKSNRRSVAAWRLDEKALKFNPVQPGVLECEREPGS